MRASIAEYLMMSADERRAVTELHDGTEPRRNPRVEDDEEFEGEATERGHR